MNQALAQIHRRRAWLVQRAAEQRRTLSALYGHYEKPIQTSAVVLSYLRFFKSPIFLTGFGALMMRTRWKKFSGMPKWAWRGWKLVQLGRLLAISRGS